jgi:hypothetical protein
MRTKRIVLVLLIASATLVALAAQGMMGGGYGGMMGGYGSGMMDREFGGMMGRNFGGMMGGNQFFATPPNVEPIGMDKARNSVLKLLASRLDKNLTLDEIIQFTNGYYALIKEKDSGKAAMELLIDPYTGSVSPEFGPNMMWNAKYGPMSFWQGDLGGKRLTAEEAKTALRRYLDFRGDTTNYDFDLDEFYGYDTIDLVKDGKIAGMVSVNTSTGAVWYHSWHGAFVAKQ